MRILLSGVCQPKVTLTYYERAFSKVGSVTYCGLPYKFERMGYAPDVDLGELAKKKEWDMFLYIEEWQQGFPLGIEKLPFPTVAYFPDAGYHLQRHLAMAPFFDYVFVAQRWTIPVFRRIHPHVYYLPFACDPEAMKRIAVKNSQFDVAFIGTPYDDRRRILDRLSKEFRMNSNDLGFEETTLEYMASVYSHSKIVFNKLPIGYNDYIIRVFEALCCGSLLLTDIPSGVDNHLFEPGKHLAAYSSDDEVIPLIRYYLEHEEERAAIAEAGYKLVLEKHTYDHRVQAILETIKKNSNRMEAPLRVANKQDCFLHRQKVFSYLMMLDTMYKLMTTSDVPFSYRIRGLWYIAVAIKQRLRFIGWRRLIPRFSFIIERKGKDL